MNNATDKVKEDLREQLEKILLAMEDRGFKTYMVSMTRAEIELTHDLLQEEAIIQPDEYERIYQGGYESGYKRALVDTVKLLKEMEWHGGDKQEKRADGMPEHHARGAADMQRKLQRAGTEAGDGGSLGAMPAEGGHT